MSMMPEFDSKSLEILRMARELVINEHTDRRAEMHNQWLVESNELWRTRRVRLAYPSIPPYPNENDIIARAQKLLEFLSQASTKEPTLSTAEPVKSDTEIVQDTVVEPKSDVAVESIEFTEPTDADVREIVNVEVADATSTVTPTPTVQELMDYMKEARAAEPEPTGILPSLLKKIEEIRGSRNSNAE